MATLKQQRRELEKKAQQYQIAMRKKLESIVQPGVGNGLAMDPLGASRQAPKQIGGQNFRFGQTVTEADVKRLIDSSGGNPYINALREVEARAKDQRKTSRQTGRMSRGVSKAAEQNAETALQELAAQFQQQQDEANYWNEYRYQQGLGENAFLRERNQDRVQNFGHAARADLDERFSENLANVTANLSSRGLGNSTITSAFDAKNARDLAREQQRLSEMVDDRASRYDTADTQNLVGFIERRDDIAPDFSQLSQLAQAYGASGASGMGGLEQLAGQQRQPEQAVPLQFGMNLPYSTSPWNAGRIANSVQGSYGNLGGMVQSPRPLTSNAYPVRRSPEDYQRISAAAQSVPQVRRTTTLPASTRLDQLQYLV